MWKFRRLSELFVDICNEAREDNKFNRKTKRWAIKTRSDGYAYKFMWNLSIVDDMTLMRGRRYINSTVIFYVSSEFFDEKLTILSFLFMCENLIDGKIPLINEYNIGKFQEWQEAGLVKPIYEGSKMITCSCNKSVIKKKYTRLEYPVGYIEDPRYEDLRNRV